MYNIGFFLAGAFLLYTGRVILKQTRSEHEAEVTYVKKMPFLLDKLGGIIFIILGVLMIFGSILFTDKTQVYPPHN